MRGPFDMRSVIQGTLVGCLQGYIKSSKEEDLLLCFASLPHTVGRP